METVISLWLASLARGGRSRCLVLPAYQCRHCITTTAVCDSPSDLRGTLRIKSALRVPMKYQKAIQRIKSGSMSRAELVKLKRNADDKYEQGDLDAKHVIDAINNATPADSYILFMGFCPDANFNNRLDIEWKGKGICRFDYHESEHQVERFNSICKGDLVVLKKIEKFGKTMALFGHGRVSGIAYDDNNIRYLEMDWSNQEQVIEVPLMACNSTVDIRSIEAVEDEMPGEFYEWLEA